MSKLTALASVAVGIVASVLLWFVSWILYEELGLYSQMSPKTFQNYLAVGMGLTILAVGVVTLHKLGVRHLRDPASPAQPSLKELREDFDRLSMEVREAISDIKAFCPICKTREETSDK